MKSLASMKSGKVSSTKKVVKLGAFVVHPESETQNA